jgi:hypothetical protein
MLPVVHETIWKSLSTLLLAFAVTILCPLPTTAADALSTGQQIYARQCAECHGVEGEGVEDQYPDPLQGDRSLEDLAAIIGDTMPEDDPDACTGEAARKVAEYIYGTFYSEAARARHIAPRIALSRLTARQYVESAADLIGAFTGAGKLDDQRGLKGRYFKARNFRQDKKAFERIDDQVDFDFGGASPDPDKIGKEEFAIQWRGGVLAEETGEYEFHLKTQNGARLWVNNDTEPLIDAWVQSGDATDHHASIHLLGGHVYPIRLDYFKLKGKTASVTLEWKAPHHVREVIPKRQLSPNWFPAQLVVQTQFPPDDRSMGYERGTSVSPLWEEATTYAAIEVSNAVMQNLSTLAKCKPAAADRAERLKDFCYRFVARAFRRPLSAAEKRFFVETHFESSSNPELAVKKTILLALTSPRFLYLGLPSAATDDYAVAERLAYGLWDSLPDAKLLQAAAQGKLQTPDQVAAQAQRMVTDRRTRTKLRDFLHQWLTIDRAAEIAKDKDQFPNFNAAVLADMRTSLDLLLDDAVWGEPNDFRQLLLADYWMLNDRLAKFYDVPLPPGRGFRKVSVDPTRRAGILTDPLLLTFLAYYKPTSPIHRGVFIIRSLLGRSLRPPPIAVTPLEEDARPEMTTRERVALQTRPSNCQTCHRMINPLGFSLEQYDAVGRFRTKERDRTIDASGSYQGVSEALVEFVGARQLAEFLARSPEVHRWFVEQLFHNVVKQPVAAYGPEQLPHLVESFADGEFSVRQLLVEIMKSTALTKQPQADE